MTRHRSTLTLTDLMDYSEAAMPSMGDTMNSTIDSYFATVRQIAAERGATYSHGTTWAAVDSTRDGERVVVEVSFYDGEDTPYYVGEVFDVNALDPSVIESHLDGFMGTDSAELYRKMGQWV